MYSYTFSKNPTASPRQVRVYQCVTAGVEGPEILAVVDKTPNFSE